MAGSCSKDHQSSKALPRQGTNDSVGPRKQNNEKRKLPDSHDQQGYLESKRYISFFCVDFFVQLNLPFNKKSVVTKTLEWSLTLCIFSYVFDARNMDGLDPATKDPSKQYA